MPRLLKYPISRGHLLKTSTKYFFLDLVHTELQTYIIHLTAEAYDSYLKYQASPYMPRQAKTLLNYPISKGYLLKTSTLFFLLFLDLTHKELQT